MMDRVIVGAFPGQGSQTPGFLAPWLELDGVSERIAEASEFAQVDLAAAGTSWSEDAIRDTRVAQPLIVAASLVSYAALSERNVRVAGVAGHSVGEVAALVAADVLTFADGMRLVGVRGRAMAEAASTVGTGMSAVVGGTPDTVLEAVSAAGAVPANYNGAGQVVAAGPLESLAALAASPPRGARVITLQVAGAFHTEFMAPAVEELAGAVETVSAVDDPSMTLWSNRDGAVVTSGADALTRLVHQVSHPVRWDLCMEAFAASGITGLVEFAPAGALVGLAKRGLKGVPTVAVKTPDDLETAAALIA